MKHLLLACAATVTALSAQWSKQSPLPSGLAIHGAAFVTADHGWLVNSGSRWDGPARRAMLETTDGGASWREVLVPASDDDPLHGVGFRDALHGWTFGNHNYRTLDGGQTWQPMPFLGSTYGMRFHTATFGSAVGNFGFAHTADGGASWTVPTAGPQSFDFRDASLGLGAGPDGVWRTTDGGRTFSNARGANATAVAFLAAPVAVAIADDQLLRSTDDGRSWSVVGPAHGRNRLQVVSTQVVLAWAGSGTVPNPDGRLLRSADAGASWNDLGTVFPRGTGSFSVAAPAIVFSADPTADVWRSLDAGATWTRVLDAPFVGFSNQFALATPVPGTAYLAYGHGLIFKSQDLGNTWAQISNGYGADLDDVALLDDDTLVAVGIDGTVLRTDDGGRNWDIADDGIESQHDLVAVQALNDSIVYTVTRLGTLLGSLDAGRSWTTLGAVPDPRLEFRTGDLHFLTPLDGWVVGTRFNLPAVFRTRDGGRSWETLPFPGLFVAIDAAGPNVWIADNHGTYVRSEDGGRNWVFGNFPPDPVALDVLDLEFWDEDVGYVVGERGYIARSSDGGRTWTRLPSPGATIDLSDLFLTAADEVWASTYDDAIYRSRDGGRTWTLEPLRSEPLAFGSFTGVAARADGTAWAVGFKGHVYARAGTTTPAGFAPFGFGCGASGAVPALTAEGGRLPWLGEPFGLRVAPVGAAASPFVLMGDSATAWGTLPLPLDLAFLAMPGCALRANPLALAPAARSGAGAVLGFLLPQDPSLVGGVLHAQSLVLDANANPAGVAWSNGATLRIGAR